MTFRTVLFNGYHKEEVDNYIEVLMEELEKQNERKASAGISVQELTSRLESETALRKELEAKLQEQSQMNLTESEQMEERLRSQDARLAENSQLIEELGRKLEEAQKQLMEKKQAYREYDELKAAHEQAMGRLKRYEKDYTDLLDVMVDMKSQARELVEEARSNADHLLDQARQDADRITEDAKAEADGYRQNAEEEIAARREQEVARYQKAYLRLSGYLEMLNSAQDQLIEVYREFGKVIGQLPLRIEDIMPQEETIEQKTDERIGAGMADGAER